MVWLCAKFHECGAGWHVRRQVSLSTSSPGHLHHQRDTVTLLLVVSSLLFSCIRLMASVKVVGLGVASATKHFRTPVCLAPGSATGEPTLGSHDWSLGQSLGLRRYLRPWVGWMEACQVDDHLTWVLGRSHHWQGLQSQSPWILQMLAK